MSRRAANVLGRDENMDTATLIDSLYQRLTLETVARHEVGHAVMAHQCGGCVKRIVVGSLASGAHFGRAFWSIPTSLNNHVLVLSGGVLALYLQDHPSDRTFDGFCNWASTRTGYAMAASGAADWSEILSLTDQPQGYGMEDFLERAVGPYFDDGISLLAKASDQLNGLTEAVLTQLPGIGRRSLKRFFAGRPRSRWAEWLDRPGVLMAANAERRAHGLID